MAELQKLKVKYRVLNRKPETRNVVIPKVRGEDKQGEEIKKVLAGEFRVPVSAIKLIKDTPPSEAEEFKGGEPDTDKSPQGPMTAAKIKAMKKPELLKYAEVNEFDLGDEPEKITEDELREIVAMLFEDREKGLDDKK